MISDGGHYVDGSWLLSIRIDSLNVDRQMRVKGDWSIGRVLVGLIEGLAHPQKLACEASDISLTPGLINSGWSDFALWWPLKNRWILQTHASLDQYGLQADARLHFIRVHGRLRVQLPDLQTRVFCDVNFTEPVFRVVILICKHLGIAHPEELSLQHADFDKFCSPINGKVPLNWNEQWSTLPASARKSFRKLVFTSPSKTDIRQKRPTSCVLPSIDQTYKTPPNVITSNQTLPRRPQIYGPPRVRNRPVSGNSPLSPTRPDSIYLSQSLYGAPLSKLEICDDPSLVSSPQMVLSEALVSGGIQRQRSFFARARFSNVWLELGRSLMEQGICPATLNLDDTLDSTTINPEPEGKENGVNGVGTDEIPMLRLRFKYNAFYELTRKNNAVRINQLFEQARWSVVSETIECTNEEAALFAALQLQVRAQLLSTLRSYFSKFHYITNLQLLQRSNHLLYNKANKSVHLFFTTPVEFGCFTCHSIPFTQVYGCSLLVKLRKNTILGVLSMQTKKKGENAYTFSQPIVSKLQGQRVSCLTLN